MEVEKKNEVDSYYKQTLLSGSKKILELFLAKEIESSKCLTMLGIELQRYCLMVDRPFEVKEDNLSDSSDVTVGSSDETDEYADDVIDY